MADPRRSSRPAGRGSHRGDGVIGAALTIVGEVRGEGPLVVEGRVEGQITIDGALTITESGVVEGDLRAGSVEVLGVFDGTLRADDLAVVHAGARLRGAVDAGGIHIADGADVDARFTMQLNLPEGV